MEARHLRDSIDKTSIGCIRQGNTGLKDSWGFRFEYSWIQIKLLVSTVNTVLCLPT